MVRNFVVSASFFAIGAAALAGCGDDDDMGGGSDSGAGTIDGDVVVDGGADGDDGGIDALDGGGEPDSGAPMCEPVDPPCIDQHIALLDLFDTVAPGAITEEGTTPGEFTTHIDATAGGMMATESFVYARFTDAGLAKVEISDEDAFASTGWDIAFRRFLVRVNSGDSGSSCVTVGRTAPGTTFDGLAAVPDGLTPRTDDYLTDTCELVPDGSGLGSPATALSSFWTYPGCVSMTHNVYVLTLADGRHVKLEVLGYYPADKQAMCDESGRVTMPSMGANYRVRWAFLGA